MNPKGYARGWRMSSCEHKPPTRLDAGHADEMLVELFVSSVRVEGEVKYCGFNWGNVPATSRYCGCTKQWLGDGEVREVPEVAGPSRQVRGSKSKRMSAGNSRRQNRWAMHKWGLGPSGLLERPGPTWPCHCGWL